MNGNSWRIIGIAALGLLAVCLSGWLVYLLIYPPSMIPAPPPATKQSASVVAPVFDVVRVDAQGNTVLAGRGAPGASVTVADNGAALDTVAVDTQGAFVMTPDRPLTPGAHELSLSETLSNGTVVVGVQTASVDVPASAGGKALTVLSGPGGSTVLSGQGPAAGTLGLGTVDYDANGHAIFSGTAPAGTHVNVTLNGVTLGQAVANMTGWWGFTTQVPGAGGNLVVSGTAPGGAALAAVNVPFTLETLQGALADGHIIITPGDNLWVIARHVYGRGILYTVIYGANANQIHNPNLIFPGQNFALPKPKG
jgi:nucleoid-associated protein YgaU